jgi:hypothetical protein
MVHERFDLGQGRCARGVDNSQLLFALFSTMVDQLPHAA